MTKGYQHITSVPETFNQDRFRFEFTKSTFWTVSAIITSGYTRRRAAPPGGLNIYSRHHK